MDLKKLAIELDGELDLDGRIHLSIGELDAPHMHERDYNKAFRLLNSTSCIRENYTIYPSWDVSSHNYWANIMKEPNHVGLAIDIVPGTSFNMVTFMQDLNRIKLEVENILWN